MPIKKITDTDYLIKVIDDAIKDLQLRKAEILARQPKEKPTGLMTHWVMADGRKKPIKGRKTS